MRTAFAHQSDALELLPTKRRQLVTRRLALMSEEDVVADPVAAMDFRDLLDVVKRSEPLLQAFGDYAPDYWRQNVAAPICALRHDVMHTVRTLVTDAPASLARLIAVDERLRALLGRIRHAPTAEELDAVARSEGDRGSAAS